MAQASTQQSIITHGCLQALYIHGEKTDSPSPPVKIYSEYLDVFLVYDGEIKIKVFGAEKNLNSGDIFFCTQSTYAEVSSNGDAHSYVRLRFLKSKIPTVRSKQRFAASLVGGDLVREKIFAHSLTYIKFAEARKETLSEKEVELVHNENLEIIQMLEGMIEQKHESLHIIQHKINSGSLIVKAVDIFEENIESSIRLKTVSEELQVSHSYFIRDFKNKVGVVPNVFRRTMKLNHSLSILSMKLKSLSEISYVLGFTDQSHFTNTFKKFLQFTPGRIN